MANSVETGDQLVLLAEVGAMRYEAIGHFIIDGDYKSDHLNDFSGAYAEYFKAWSMLVTAKARKILGASILEALADLAVQSGDPKLIEQAQKLSTTDY